MVGNSHHADNPAIFELGKTSVGILSYIQHTGNPNQLPLGYCLSYGILLSLLALVLSSVREYSLSLAAEMLHKLDRSSAIDILQSSRANDNLLLIAIAMYHTLQSMCCTNIYAS